MAHGVAAHSTEQDKYSRTTHDVTSFHKMADILRHVSGPQTFKIKLSTFKNMWK
jgi:hypothetical protein